MSDFQPIPLDEIPSFEIEEGITIYVNNDPNVEKSLLYHDIDMYYILSLESYNYKTQTGTTSTAYRPQIYKVVNNMVSRAVIPVGSDFKGHLVEMSGDVWFSLPKIPVELIAKVDDFLRLVDEKNHSEAIVLLTFDENANGPEGWGVCVPEQTNTGTHCDYKPDSIAAEKPDHVAVVGSIHSHPGMSAHASGTDHKDQANFDGLHITFGWSNATHNETEYHVEIQCQGTAYVIDPEAVFAKPARPERDPVIDSWMDKVSKSAPTGYTGSTGSSATGGYAGASQWTGTSSFAEKGKVPAGFPAIDSNVWIGELTSPDEKLCPFCMTALLPTDLQGRRCLACHNFLCLPDETLSDIVIVRYEQKIYAYDLDVVEESPGKDIYVWRRAKNLASGGTYEKIYDAPKTSASS